MGVSWVAGSPFAYQFGTTTITLTTPAGIEDGDTVLAGVHGGFALSGPSGWTKVFETDVFTEYSTNQRLAIFSKDEVTEADASEEFEFSQSSEGAMAVVCAVGRDALSIAFSGVTTGSVNSYSVTPSVATATENDSMILIFASSVLWPPGPGGDGIATPQPPPSFTLTSGTSLLEYNLAAAYRLVGNGVSNSGAFDFQPSGGTPAAFYGSNNNLAAVTVLLGPSDGGGGIVGISSVGGPLGHPSAFARHIPLAGRSSASTMLGAVAVLSLHDFTAAVSEKQSLFYVMDLITPGGLVRAPISSWQATLQTEQANYVQCVVPACLPYVDHINAATAFRISRRARLQDGTFFEYVMAEAPLDNPSLAQGTGNYTATLSGYSPGLVIDEDPPESTGRTLQGVRTIFTQPSGLRVRCAVDWLLRPAQLAFVDGSSFVVAYINYYVSDGDQYMDVGERAEAA